jgi:hypothetical protein
MDSTLGWELGVMAVMAAYGLIILIGYQKNKR